MLAKPSKELLYLASTLLEQLSLSSSQPLDENVLLQLQAIFGPMLLSALQLIDRREVVMVSLPTGRTVYQVSASTGKPYTLHLDLPDLTPPDIPLPPPHQSSPPVNEIEPPLDIARPESDAPPSSEVLMQQQRQERLSKMVQSLEGIYCPCTGFAYNSLASDKNYFCKHLLAVVLAHQMGRAVKTEVNLPRVIELLGLSGSSEVKEERLGLDDAY